MYTIVADDARAKQRFAKSVQGAYAANEAKILGASHVCALCTRVTLTPDHLEQILARETADGRFPPPRHARGCEAGPA